MKITKLKTASIAQSNLSELVLRALEDRSFFVGAAGVKTGKIYSGSVFADCIADGREGLEYEAVSNEIKKAVKELHTLNKKISKYDLVLVFND